MDKSTKDIEAFDPINLCHVGWRRFTLCSGHTEVDAAGSVLRRTGRGGSPGDSDTGKMIDWTFEAGNDAWAMVQRLLNADGPRPLARDGRHRHVAAAG